MLITYYVFLQHSELHLPFLASSSYLVDMHRLQHNFYLQVMNQVLISTSHITHSPRNLHSLYCGEGDGQESHTHHKTQYFQEALRLRLHHHCFLLKFIFQKKLSNSKKCLNKAVQRIKFKMSYRSSQTGFKISIKVFKIIPSTMQSNSEQ